MVWVVFKEWAALDEPLGPDLSFGKAKVNLNPSGLLTLASWPHM